MANNFGFTFGELNDSSANDGYGGLFVKFLNTVGSNSAGTKQPALLFDMRDSGTPIDWTNITSPLLINGNGLAINSDSPPAAGYALHVNTGNLKVESSSNNTQLELLATGGTNQTFKIFSATSSNSSGAGLHFQNATADTIPLSIKSNGYVGIGTTSPQDSLHINGNIRLASDSIIWAASGTHDHNNGNLKLRSGGNGTGDPVDVHAWSGTGAELEIDGDYNDGYFKYTHNSSTKFTINGASGNVGIGSSPHSGRKLKVNGKTQIIGDLDLYSGYGWFESGVAPNLRRDEDLGTSHTTTNAFPWGLATHFGRNFEDNIGQNSAGGYCDCISLNNWGDSSGGGKNMICVSKTNKLRMILKRASFSSPGSMFGSSDNSFAEVITKNKDGVITGAFNVQTTSGDTVFLGNSRNNYFNVGWDGTNSYRKIHMRVDDTGGSGDAQMYFVRNGSWKSHNNFSSDRRIKDNIEEYPPADSLNIVKNIKVKKYYQTQEKKECRGFIAQEITDYVPEAVEIHNLKEEGLLEDYHMLDYRRVLVHSFGAIQELDRIKTEQEGRIQTLETQLADVLTRLEALENP